MTAGVLSMSALAACGGGDTGEQAAPPADTTAMAPAPAPTTDSSAMAAPAPAANLPEGVTPEMVAAGDAIFHGAGGCIACHGPDAKGTALAPDLTDDVWLHTTGRNYDEIVKLITTGVPQPTEHPAPMPPKGGSSITDEQVHQVAAYVVSLGS